jgi:hypothetical protein
MPSGLQKKELIFTMSDHDFTLLYNELERARQKVSKDLSKIEHTGGPSTIVETCVTILLPYKNFLDQLELAWEAQRVKESNFVLLENTLAREVTQTSRTCLAKLRGIYGQPFGIWARLNGVSKAVALNSAAYLIDALLSIRWRGRVEFQHCLISHLKAGRYDVGNALMNMRGHISGGITEEWILECFRELLNESSPFS